ncbi:hypothetical protein ACFSC6_08455 [Rufibacter sediminis]|uniref:STAS/SEC14 domain-containing protein n=1 Tax=Rufibacter sediminis TaxID=2762756 RepID=A0ABR6VMI6_9BACT|nr:MULTISPECIES: hypothetical protein [Rufibacter]MBC3538363.1 hypothetical protein [Rufibacter sediminis]
MILFQNHLIILDYNPSTDILSVDWPNVNSYDLLEIERSLSILVDYIRSYDVKRLLIDSSKTVIHPDIDRTTYLDIVTRFAKNLQNTRLQKSASILHTDTIRQQESEQISEEVTSKVELKIQSQTFATKKAALEWLKQEG